MEQDVLLCAKFILEINKDGYYVESDVLEAAKRIVNDYVSENDCFFDDDAEGNQYDDNFNWD